MITAQEARAKTDSLVEGENAKFLNAINQAIEMAAQSGQFCTSVNIPSKVVCSAIKKHLESLGYSVTLGNGYRDGNFIRINW